MSIYTFLPVVAIVLGIAYAFWFRKNMAKHIASGQGPLLFHNSHSGHFKSIGENEFVIAVWYGLVYIGSETTADRVGRAALNQVTSVAGYTQYTPGVIIVLTSLGRLLAAEEFSELGVRGNFREAFDWGPGATATTGQEAVPQHNGTPPKNPYNPNVAMQLTQLLGAEGSTYVCWLSMQSLEISGTQRQISAVLPISPDVAQGIWTAAVQQARTYAAANI